MKTVAIVAILTSATLTWAQSYSIPPGRQAAKPQPARPAQKPRSPEQKMWCPVLEYALSGAKSFELPMRAYLLDTAALGLGKCDAAKVRIALVDSFTATLLIPEKEEDIARRSASEDGFSHDQPWFESFSRVRNKRRLQQSALMHLLSVDEAKTELLLDLAEPRVRAPILSTIISKAVGARNYDHALELLNRVPPSGFPYGEATQLVLTLPPSRDTDKQEIFRLAMAADREQHSLVIGGDDFASMIIRFWQHVPPAVAMEAIHQVLDAAQSMKGTGITLNAASGNVGFASEYDYRVFELLPILRQLDDSEADKLLSGSQQAQFQLQQFPNGLQSINPVIRDTPAKQGEHAQISGSLGPANSVGQALQEANTTDAYNSRITEIVRMAGDNPRQAIAAAATLPDSDGRLAFRAENPRAKALLAVAQAVMKKNPSEAKEALEGMAEVLKNAAHPYRSGMGNWAEGMNIARQVGEADLALKLFRSGMDQADKLGGEDADSDDPNLALKAWWPSVSAAWQLVRAASEISPGVALERVGEIKDPEILLLLEVRLANKGLGARIDQSITEVRKKSSHESWAEYRSGEE
jgi:hypothetical protein